jgi:hypothetical protein
MLLLSLIYAPAAVVYVAAVIFRALSDSVLLDRYAIPVIPLLVILLLWHFEHRMRRALPAVGWTVLAIFALYGTANAHDYLASERARLRAATALTAAGIPRTSITAGIEYDGWTELEHSGYINSPETLNPPTAWRSQEDRAWPVSPPFWFWDWTPSLDPRWFITHTPLPGLVESPFPPVFYTTWLPPRHRRFLTEELPRSR